jgi:SAM-dependent methyltransferase
VRAASAAADLSHLSASRGQPIAYPPALVASDAPLLELQLAVRRPAPVTTASAFTRADWDRLRELREQFLAAESGPTRPYWRARRDFELYDATFARRIAWKWGAVIDELVARGRMPRIASVLDWGCGTGVASRVLAERVPGIERVALWDRARDAAEFARERLRAERPELEVAIEAPGAKGWPDALLVSHVLDELAEADLAELMTLVRKSRVAILVEPGSRVSSRRLVAMRDELRGEFAVLAPCTHSAACGMRASAHGWCHHFTRPPADVFTSAFWRRFADELGIDLRSVPYAFLALSREPATADAVVARILGRPRVTKGRAALDVCDASGVRELSFLERTDKTLFKRLDRAAHEPLLRELGVDGDRATVIRERGREEGGER